jgi:putative PIN family toxin of toxin-antitoxin system
MRAVVDTNILIRALIRPQGSAGPVLQYLRDGRFQIVYSEALLDELIAKLALPRLRNKYHLDDESLEAFLALLALRGELVAPQRRIEVCRDAQDNMVIEAAVAGAANCIASSDEDLLVLGAFEDIRIIPPEAFVALLTGTPPGDQGTFA